MHKSNVFNCQDFVVWFLLWLGWQAQKTDLLICPGSWFLTLLMVTGVAEFVVYLGRLPQSRPTPS